MKRGHFVNTMLVSWYVGRRKWNIGKTCSLLWPIVYNEVNILLVQPTAMDN